MIKACIFNLEGVIVDTQRIFYEALDDLAQKWGIEHVERPDGSDVIYGATRKIALEALIQHSGKIIDAAQRSDIMEAIDAEIAAHIASITPDDLEDDVFVFIKELKNKGLNLGIVSAYPNTRQVLNRLQITHLFYSIVEIEGGGFASIPPEAYLQAAKDLGMSPDETIVFEHTKDGAAAAGNANFFVVGVGRADDLQDESDLVIPDFDSVRFRKIITALGTD
jgi:beta-phosphoglucomutase